MEWILYHCITLKKRRESSHSAAEFMLIVIDDGDKVLFQKLGEDCRNGFTIAIFCGQTTFIVFKKKQITFIRTAIGNVHKYTM